MDCGTCGATLSDGSAEPCWTTKTVAISSIQKLDPAGISRRRMPQRSRSRASENLLGAGSIGGWTPLRVGLAGIQVVPVQDGVEGEEVGSLRLPAPEGPERE